MHAQTRPENPHVRVDGAVAVRSILWSRTPGETICTVIAKSTYALLPGECELAPIPDPVLSEEVHWFGDPRRSVATPSDWAPAKPVPEVTLSGSAFAAAGTEPTRVYARLVLGSIDKAIEAWAPRAFSPTSEVLVRAGQSAFPLAWEFAAGQGDTGNPVGVECSSGGAIPSLQPAGFHVGQPSDHVPSVSFAPIPAGWPARRRLLRPEHLAWIESGFAGVMPADLDLRWFQCAPPDQRLEGALPSDARLVLEGLHAEHPRLITNLPRVEPRLYVWSPHERIVRMPADSLHIDTDQRRVTMTWRASFSVHRGVLATVTLRRMAEPVDFAEARRLRDLHESDTSGPRTLQGTERTAADLGPAAAAALPFGPGSGAAPDPGAAPAPALVGHARAPSMPPMAPALAPPMAPPMAPALVPPLAPPMTAPAAAAARAPAPAPVPTGAAPPGPVFREQVPPPLPMPPLSTSFPVKPLSLATPAEPSAPRQSEPRAVGGMARESRRGQATSSTPIERRALVDLLHHEPTALARVQRDPHMRDVLSAATTPMRRAVDAVPRSEDVDARDRLRMLRLLSCGAPTEGGDLREVIRQRLTSSEAFEPPLVLVEAELHPSFDEIELLRATLAVAKPLGAGDKRIAPVVQHAELQLQGDSRLAGEVATALARQLETATSHLSLPPRFVEKTAERTLLEGRKFRRRDLFGASYLRTEIHLPRLGRIPAYLPAEVASKLPLLPSLTVILLGELRPREDAWETEKDAFLAIAVARRLDAGGGDRDAS